MRTHLTFSILTALLVVLATTVPAQEQLQDVVYLKNGSIIRGVIIEQVPGKTIKVRAADGSVFVYNIDDVEKMTKEAPPRGMGQTGELTEGFGMRGSGGLDVIEGGLAFGGGFSYAWGAAQKGTALEFGLVALYAPDTELFIGGVVVNWLFNYAFKNQSVFLVAGTGAAFGSIEDVGSAGAWVSNLGIGGAFGGGFEVRLETPLLLFIGDGVAFAPTVALSLGARF